MESREGAEELRGIIPPEKNIDDIATLRARVEQIRAALEKRAGRNQYQQLLIRAAIGGVVRYLTTAGRVMSVKG